MKPPPAVAGAVTLLAVCALTAAGPVAQTAAGGSTEAAAGARLRADGPPPGAVGPQCDLVHAVQDRPPHSGAG